ncbi:MAG TPA: hypothetical protein DIU15_10445, partial [Deltaproteobacteria bacterium]|nr:hypothetical protein [Deltaproteobacteria bacterium]
MAPADPLQVLAGIQRHLQAIYDLDLDLRVEDFLIGDREMAVLVDQGAVPEVLASTHEQLLILPDDDGISVALYLSDALQESLAAGPDLQDHCHATEGVSHFLMLLWIARQERQVRRLHLELQAEVDKATTCLLLERGATGGAGASSLLRRLFSDVALADHLEPHERERYVHAHQLASEYSRFLARR